MVMNFIRSNKIIAGLLTILRIFIGYKFISMGYMKISGGGFDAGGFIQYATETPSVPGWWATFSKSRCTSKCGVIFLHGHVGGAVCWDFPSSWSIY